MTDLCHIRPHHELIDRRCIEWGKWARVHNRPFGVQPMWRHYMSTARHWDIDPHVPVAINALDALEIERAVAQLPEKFRTVLRWHYVWPSLHPNSVARQLDMCVDDLTTARDSALDCLMTCVL